MNTKGLARKKEKFMERVSWEEFMTNVKSLAEKIRAS